MVKTKKTPNSGSKTRPGISRSKTIEEAAYFRWLARNRETGKDLEDWLGAERELMENIFEQDVES